MSQQQQRWVIIPAGGIGSRMGLPFPKQLLPFKGRTVIEAVVSLFEGYPVVVPVPAEHRERFEAVLGDKVRVIDGGATRFESVKRGFDSINPGADDLVCIHDAARPFLDRNTLAGAFDRAEEVGALIYAAVATDTIKKANDKGLVEETLDRNRIYAAQTPQIFKASVLRTAYEKAESDAAPTDEAGLVEAAGIPVTIHESSRTNTKLTLKEDLALVAGTQMAIGHGFDVHRFDETRPLYLGGILIPDTPGLLGHSDADVVLHALIDALLGAAGLGDIGQHFPDTDAAFKGIRSTVLLDRVWSDLKARGWRLGNADMTIQAQAPKLAPHIATMRETISKHLDGGAVNLKATTTEKLGFVGRREGIAVDAVVLLTKETEV